MRWSAGPYPPLVHTLAAWTHDLSPFALRITESFGIRWYGLSYVAGFLVAWWWLSRLARRRQIMPAAEQVGDLMLAVIVGTVVGGRLGYVLIYRPELLWEFTKTPPFWGVLDVLHGGMASHGGMVGIILGCAWAARRFKAPALHLMDCICLVAPVGIFFGRLANFVNGELLGKIMVQPADLAADPNTPVPWWGVRFPQEMVEQGRWAEVKLDAAQSDTLAAVLEPLVQGQDPGHVNAAAVAVERIQNGDHALARQLEPLLSVRHPSQLYQALVEGLFLLACLWAIRRALWARAGAAEKLPHGVILAWFFILYGVGRVATEFWRLPDGHLATPRIAGLSRGQWLSVGMVVAGAVLLGWAVRRRDRAQSDVPRAAA